MMMASNKQSFLYSISSLLTTVFYFSSCVRFIVARLEAAVILPHGDFALDPTLLPPQTPARQAADAIAQAAAETGSWLSQDIINPDLLFLSTPHGIQLTHDFAIYLGSSASGFVDIGKDLRNTSHHQPPYRVHLPTIQLDADLSKKLVTEFSSKNLNVSGVMTFADDSQDMPLQWAEVIPLLLIPRRRRKPINEEKQQRRRRHLILSHPLRRYTDAATMVSELLDLGARIRSSLDGLTERVAVVISGDLSHTHLPNGPYGYSNTSSTFDAAIGAWATNPCHYAHRLLVQARRLQNCALSCGFTGLVLLHGMLCHHSSNNNEWKAEMLVNRNATYYGMMVARYVRKTFVE